MFRPRREPRLDDPPPVGGIGLRDAMREWFFRPNATAAKPPPRLVDDCGELPCTQPEGGRCVHLQADPLTARCQARLRADCPGLEAKGPQCEACLRDYASDLRQHGCPENPRPSLHGGVTAGGRKRRAITFVTWRIQFQRR